jgi:hypothetical protein
VNHIKNNSFPKGGDGGFYEAATHRVPDTKLLISHIKDVKSNNLERNSNFQARSSIP